jgi:hypothetical protein
MPTVQPFPAGGYRFISHQFQYSGGVAAEPGFRIERARFARPLPLADGFDAIEAYLAKSTQPEISRHSLCRFSAVEKPAVVARWAAALQGCHAVRWGTHADCRAAIGPELWRKPDEAARSPRGQMGPQCAFAVSSAA